MPEYRTDPLSGHTVIIAPERQSRPGAFSFPPWKGETVDCPFCRGKESETPQEICVHPADAASSEWQIRVVPNKYPALSGQSREGRDSQCADIATGLHEVIIESPNHVTSVTELGDEQLAALLRVYAERITAAEKQPGIRCAQLFKNHGPAAGATLQHTRSQLIAMDRIPDALRRELSAVDDHFANSGSCIVCDLIDQEQSLGDRIVLENDDFLAFCPYASRLPYEMRLVPRIHRARFENTNPEHWQSLASLLRQVLQTLESLIPNVCYNYLIHSLPFDTDRNEHYHWHMEIIPRIATPAGFEWGTGLFMNPMPPEQAASELRSS